MSRFSPSGHAIVGVSALRDPLTTVFPPQALGTSCKMSTGTLPLLLPASVLGVKSESDPQQWKPSRHLQAPQPPPRDDSKQHDLEMAAARQLIDGKAFKKVRPRRTVDYFAGVGRWTLVSSFAISRLHVAWCHWDYSCARYLQARGIYRT